MTESGVRRETSANAIRFVSRSVHMRTLQVICWLTWAGHANSQTVTSTSPDIISSSTANSMALCCMKEWTAYASRSAAISWCSAFLLLLWPCAFPVYGWMKNNQHVIILKLIAL